MSSSFYIDSFLSSDILLTGYEQLSYDNSIEIYQFVSLAEDWFLLHKKFNEEDLAT